MQVVAKTWVEQVHPGLKIKKLKIYVRQFNQMKSLLVILQEDFFSHSVVESVRVRHRRDEKLSTAFLLGDTGCKFLSAAPRPMTIHASRGYQYRGWLIVLNGGDCDFSDCTNSTCAAS